MNTMIEKDRNFLIPVSFEKVQIEDEFWMPKLKLISDVTLRACLCKCEETGRISNFKKAAGQMDGKYEGMLFNDSDIYKLLEGIAYSLVNQPDPDLEVKADQLIHLISIAQESDGYINTYFTLEKPQEKWIDMMAHEDYCGGHLIEAAVAYYQATGKRKLLDVAIKMADHLVSVFGEGNKHWVVVHQEIELALIKLYKLTGNEKYMHLAQWFLDERGKGHYYYKEGFSWSMEEFGGVAYCQDDRPVREMSDIKGHAVRAMYMYTGMADIAVITGDSGYLTALSRLWESVVYRNMYITGGIGSSKYNEGFTADYDLPNDTAYCETCASVGMVYWNHRMNLLHGDSKYADIMELAMYNGVLSGLSYSGDKFLYVNPLETDGTHHREAWFDVSCCPTQLSRFIPSVGNYLYAVAKEGVYVNLYIASNSVMDINNSQVRLIQRTEYPWDNRIAISVDLKQVALFEINLRYPGWCKGVKVSVNGEIIRNPYIQKGYIKIFREWKSGDEITLELEMPIERIVSHPKVKMNAGRVALKRGPVVYCVEEVDNKENYDNISLNPEARLVTERSPNVLGGISFIKTSDDSYAPQLIAIPYFAWDNRKPGRIKVWIPEG